MTKRASGEKLPTVNNIHKLRVRLTTLEDGDGAGGSLTSDGPGLEISDKKIKLKDLGVVESKLAANSVTAAKIKDSIITTSHFNANILGNGIKIDSSKLTLKLNTESGLTLNGSGLSVDTLFLPTLSPWYEMALKTGWSAYASEYGYKVEYRFIEYETERRYFLRGHVKKSSGPTDWDIICDVAGAPNVMLPPQNQHFIVSVNDNDKNPFNFNQWTLQIRRAKHDPEFRAELKTKECWYWVRGTCPHGDKCLRRHSGKPGRNPNYKRSKTATRNYFYTTLYIFSRFYSSLVV